MRVQSCWNTTTEDIDSGIWNPYLGISINKKAFTLDYLSGFLDWALPRARDGVAIVIVDVIQRINNQVLDRAKPAAALEKAFRKADAVRAVCLEAMERQPAASRDRIVLLEWPDVMQEAVFQHNMCRFRLAFETDPAFREALVGFTRHNLGDIAGRLDPEQVETLSRYILFELPEITAGFLHQGIHYNLNVYPGRVAELWEVMLTRPCFVDLRKELKSLGPYATVELYLEAS